MNSLMPSSEPQPSLQQLPAQLPSLAQIQAEKARRSAERQRAHEAAEEAREIAAELERTNWAKHARDEQRLPAGDWLTWLVLAGRGFGKTRTGAEAIRELVCGSTPLERGRYGRIALVAETSADARDVMVEGPSGILAAHPRSFRPVYYPSKRRLVWPNGAIATLYNGTEPDQLRGPQHDLAWCDEIAKWQLAQDAWDQLQFGLRLRGPLGDRPRQIVTTTPRPIPIVRALLAASDTVTTRGHTLNNSANLAPSFLAKIMERYQGTRLGRQELAAEILDDVPGALWTREMIDQARKPVARPDFARIVVAVDPSGARAATDDGADSIGIIVAAKGVDGRGYVLADRSCKLSPDGWGRRAVAAYHEFGADRIVAERNYGGAMVEHVIRTIDESVSYREVTASRGKVVRAEPAAALYEQGKVSHVGAGLSILEDQCCQMTGDGFLGEGSPDRVDALVWALSDLFLGHMPGAGLLEHYRQSAADQAQSQADAAAARNDPSPSNGGLRMRAPAGISTIYGMTGHRYTVDADGCITAAKEDQPGLRSVGFVEDRVEQDAT